MRPSRHEMVPPARSLSYAGDPLRSTARFLFASLDDCLLREPIRLPVSRSQTGGRLSMPAVTSHPRRASGNHHGPRPWCSRDPRWCRLLNATAHRGETQQPDGQHQDHPHRHRLPRKHETHDRGMLDHVLGRPLEPVREEQQDLGPDRQSRQVHTAIPYCTLWREARPRSGPARSATSANPRFKASTPTRSSGQRRSPSRIRSRHNRASLVKATPDHMPDLRSANR